MLHSKSDFVNCLERIIAPLKDYYTPGCAGIKCGNTGVNYGEKTARMEGFARVLWGLGPLWGGKIEGDGELLIVQCESNTNLIHPYTQMPAVKYIIPKGTVTITTRVVYPD